MVEVDGPALVLADYVDCFGLSFLGAGGFFCSAAPIGGLTGAAVPLVFAGCFALGELDPSFSSSGTTQGLSIKLLKAYSRISSRRARSGIVRDVFEFTFRLFCLCFSIGSSAKATATFSLSEPLRPPSSSEKAPIPSLFVFSSSVPVTFPSVPVSLFVWLRDEL